MAGTPATPNGWPLAYSVQSRWRNRAEFLVGREQIVAFLRRKWDRELDYRLIKELGLMTARHASISDVPIREHDRKFRWPLGRRPDDHPGLSSFGF